MGRPVERCNLLSSYRAGTEGNCGCWFGRPHRNDGTGQVEQLNGALAALVPAGSRPPAQRWAPLENARGGRSY